MVRKYSAMLRALPDLMFVLTRDGEYVDFWAGREEELAMPSEAIIGSNMADMPFTRADRERIRAAIRRALTSGSVVSVPYRLTTGAGPGQWEGRIVRLDNDHVLAIARNITEQKRIEEDLRSATERLQTEKAALHKKNVALEQVLQHLEKRKRQYRIRVVREIRRELGPVLRRLKERMPEQDRTLIATLEKRLEAMLARDADPFGDRYATLTSRQLQLCDLLRDGLTSKQISHRLNLSLATVHKHREQIRRKLGFRGMRVNLSAYLRLRGAQADTQ